MNGTVPFKISARGRHQTIEIFKSMYVRVASYVFDNVIMKCDVKLSKRKENRFLIISSTYIFQMLYLTRF